MPDWARRANLPAARKLELFASRGTGQKRSELIGQNLPNPKMRVMLKRNVNLACKASFTDTSIREMGLRGSVA